MKTKDKVDRRERAFEVLHQAGWTDSAIAVALKASPFTVVRWRAERNLGRNLHEPPVKICEVEARRLYSQGAKDPIIARRFGVCQSAVTRWRQRQGLEANHPHRKLTAEQEHKARMLLRYGASRRQVADALGISGLDPIQRIRSKMKDPGLRRTGHTTFHIQARVRKDKRVQGRIDRAVGSHVPMDVRLEANAELYLAVLDGIVSVDCIEKVAPSFRNRAYSMCGASKFGTRSLDEEIGEDGWTLMDSIDDPSALETMEAAAEAAWNDN